MSTVLSLQMLPVVFEGWECKSRVSCNSEVSCLSKVSDNSPPAVNLAPNTVGPASW